MSFGEGNKGERIAELEAQVAQLKRSLGGSQAACKRLKGEKRALQEQVDRLLPLNGELCAEVNAGNKLVRGLYADLKGVAPDLARVWARAYPSIDPGKEG